ncbi:UNVERIFIED_CONTAM: hypothetical protein Sangu_2673100 [Sesamum angustifolium]|uniref:Uncharacterized protein n=1 Tax=Sesamum angustifolium TaxID=2727405 RepID=A0AAW2IZK5_9LAMI
MRPACRIPSLPMTKQMDSLLPTSSESPPMISCSLAQALSLAPTPLSSIRVSEPTMQTRVSPNPTLNCTDVGNFVPPSTLQDFSIGSSDIAKGDERITCTSGVVGLRIAISPPCGLPTNGTVPPLTAKAPPAKPSPSPTGLFIGKVPLQSHFSAAPVTNKFAASFHNSSKTSLHYVPSIVQNGEVVVRPSLEMIREGSRCLTHTALGYF